MQVRQVLVAGLAARPAATITRLAGILRVKARRKSRETCKNATQLVVDKVWPGRQVMEG